MASLMLPLTCIAMVDKLCISLCSTDLSPAPYIEATLYLERVSPFTIPGAMPR
jgi:hypothetical protein